MSSLKKLIRRLKASTSGVAAVEMALAFPFMLTAGLWGVELANFGVVNMRVSQLAAQMADNASRVGDSSALLSRKIYEADVNDLLLGAHLQGGNGMGLFDHGRVIISSLEVDDDDEQYIHWQRCMGSKNWTSHYGDEDDRLADGMGPPGYEVIALPDEAVMFVEVAYDYQPLISEHFIAESTITAISSFTVRADRDLTKIYQRDPNLPDPVADCGSYKNTIG